MRKFLAVALAALMLLALMPTASAAVGNASMDVYYNDGGTVKKTSNSPYGGTSAIVEIPYGDLGFWNIPGTAINTELSGTSTWGKFLQVVATLTVGSGTLATDLSNATYTDASTSDAVIATLTDPTSVGLSRTPVAGELTPNLYYIDGITYYAKYATNPTPSYTSISTPDGFKIQRTLSGEETIQYTCYVATVSGGNTAPKQLNVYKHNTSAPIQFWLNIQYRDNASVASGLAVSAYGINASNVRAYMSGSVLVIETVWANMQYQQDTRPVLNLDTNDQNGGTPNPNYLQSMGYYPIGLQFFFKDAAGNPLNQYTQLTSLKYGNFDILTATLNKKYAAYLPFTVESGITPINTGFGRSAYLDADGSLKLRLNIGQFGYLDQSATTGHTSADKDARFVTSYEYSQLAALSSSSVALNTTSIAYLKNNHYSALYLNGKDAAWNNTAVDTKVSVAKVSDAMLWYTNLANQYVFRDKKLVISMVYNNIAYSYEGTFEFRSTARIAASTVNLSESSITLKVGESKAITATTSNTGGESTSLPINWVSNNTAIATVTGSGSSNYNRVGTIYGVSVGSTYVRASMTNDNAEAICTVTVVPVETVVEPVAPTTVEYVVVCRALNVRTGAGTKNSKLGLVYRGDVVNVIEVNNDWAKIEWQGSTAYACLGNGKYLQPK